MQLVDISMGPSEEILFTVSRSLAVSLLRPGPFPFAIVQDASPSYLGVDQKPSKSHSIADIFKRRAVEMRWLCQCSGYKIIERTLWIITRYDERRK